MLPPPTSAIDNPRVLLVDDRPENRLALRAVLEPLGVDLDEADSGEQALKQLLGSDYAVILLDVHMPGMDGLETATCIKQRERSRDIPIIFLTAAQAEVSEVLGGYEAGAVDYLLKPFDPVVLRSKVAVFADLDRQRRARRVSDLLVERAFDATPTGAALCEAGGRIVRANRSLSELVGRPLSELHGAPVGEVLRDRDRARLSEAVASVLDGERVGSWDAHALSRSSAAPVPVRVAVVSVGDGETDAMQLLVQLTDERERKIAETLQRALLPEQLPSVPGVAIAAHISPGGEGAVVGGDWYDAIALPGGRLGVVVGDVAGRGVEAAARMGELRSVARAYALEGHGPVELVERMNGYHAALGADLMTTLLYAVFEVDTGRMAFVNAGHPPPVLVAPDATTTTLHGSGPPLGVMDTWRYDEQAVEFPAGSRALLFTDGLVERRGESLDAGLERLRAGATSGSSSDAGELCRDLALAATDGVDDDVTLVVVEAEPVLGQRALLKLAPDMQSLSSLRRLVHRWLAEAGATRDEASEIVMAANEAWQNALEHGTGFARTTVDVELLLSGRSVQVVIRDAGQRHRSPADPDRGRGIELMRALVDEVKLDLRPHGSEVRLRRALAPLPVGGTAEVPARESADRARSLRA